MRIWPEKTVDQEFADLGTAGWSGTLNDRQFAYLRNAGYTGGLPDMMFQLRTAPIVEPPAFSPADLFTGTDEGFWAPVTTSRLWQDTARTSPVTAAGQAVASWQLTTRTGVIYAEQATGTNCPTYQVDGEGAGYLQFDGSNDRLDVPSIAPGIDKVQVFAGLYYPSSVSSIVVESSTTSDGNDGTFAVITGLSNMRMRSKGTILADATGSVPLAAKFAFTGIGDISAPLSRISVDGTVGATTTTGQGTGNYLAYPIYIGRRGNSTIPFNGRIYGMVVRFGANLTAGQITNTEAWIGGLLNP